MADTQKPGPGGERAPAAGRSEVPLEERRMDMKSAEGHAGSVPRGNPEREEDHVGHLRDAYERVLGH